MTDILLSSAVWFRTVQAATSIIWVALGGYLYLRAGIINIGLEGMMLMGAFGGAVGSLLAVNSWIGLLAGAGLGLALGALFGALVVQFRCSPIVVGLGINLLALGLTAVLLQAMFGVRGGLQSPKLQALPRLELPAVAAIPWLGKVLSGQTLLTYLAWLMCPLLAWWMRATRGGLTVRVVGERPEIAAAMGRSPALVQWVVALVGGAFVGLGGVQLALGDVALFAENMTVGRGFVVLAMLLVAGPSVLMLAALSFGFAVFDVFGFSLQAAGLPAKLSGITPYVAIFFIMAAIRLAHGLRPASRVLQGPLTSSTISGPDPLLPGDVSPQQAK